ncbi:MAG: glycoside hydrolase family 3 C-terminal domain-containing protein [Oscillospiraceae bacterium]|nr:glycoside hydrolase family 3 C-terminal domain-containing protein [Oscillospiraceae bacterium]
MSEAKRFYPGQETDAVSPRERHGREVARKAAAQGMVLLENNGALPLAKGARLALFGVGARHTIKGGTGSGDVNSRSTVSVDEGLRGAGFEIVNSAYLDAFDEGYAKAMADWEAAIYAAGANRNFQKFYDAHAKLKPAIPEDVPLPLAECAAADAAVYVISRTAGENVDREDAEGDYYLSPTELRELKAVRESAKRLIVILNVGGIIDLGFTDEIKPDALVLMGQAGVEGGSALADLLSGAVNPCGRLSDSWAVHYLDYPSSEHFSHRDGNLLEEYYTDGIYVGYRYFDTFGVKPRYPFGYGLSYTAFSQECVSAELTEDGVRVTAKVKNTGTVPGRQVLQLYAACPAAEQKKEFKRLVAFGKTGLLAPGAEERVSLCFPLSALASWRSGKAAYFLEKGVYTLLLGASAEDYAAAAKLTLAETLLLEQHGNVCELLESLKELSPTAEQIAARDAALKALAAEAPTLSIDALAAAVAAKSAAKPEQAPDEVWERAKQIVESMTEDEKIRMVVGAPSAMSGDVIGSAANTLPGAAGETVGYEKYGVSNMILADGPAGIRIQLRYEIDPATGEVYKLDRFATLENRFFGKLEHHPGAKTRWQFATAIPVGTLLAQTFDAALVAEVGEMIAGELVEFGVTAWLGPGMNIHRNPLCGRNFEYFSEDPLLSGMMAAAITKGVQSVPGIGTTIKHYACNNQEDNRWHINAVLSERALREIYLKGFEIAIKSSQPLSIMTSYNRVNCVHAANSYDLCTTLAREEWGFEGFIMTDWTTTNAGHGSSAAKCIRAGNDLVMPGTDSDREEIRAALHGEGEQFLPAERLDLCAARIVAAALKSRPHGE